MEPKEIQRITERITKNVIASNKGVVYHNYDTFLGWFEMERRRNIEILKVVDSQLKKNWISLWTGKSGKERRNSVSDYSKGELIIFRLDTYKKKVENPRGEKITLSLKSPKSNIAQNAFINTGIQTVANKNAGTIQIAKGDSDLRLYKHQEDAIVNLNNKILKSNKSSFAGLVVLPTGGGKTLTAAYWLCKNLLDKKKKVLWIAHRHELLEQAKETFHYKLAFKDVFSSRQSFNYRIISGIHDKPVNIKSTDDIIISSKDSLNAGFDHLFHNWLNSSNEEVFLVIDEAHHATAKTYRKLINNLQEKGKCLRVIGLTATPFRTAEVEQGLLAKVFPDDIIYKIDLRTLINRGILSEPVFEEVNTDFDMTQVLSDKELDNIGYFDIDSIGKATAKTIAENAQRNWCIVNRYISKKAKYKQTIVFALNQDNAIALTKLFREQGVRADYVLSAIKDQATGITISSKENKDRIDDFRKGKLDVLINVNILTEGTDLPGVQSVFLARPTISPILMTQMIGRGLRGEKAGGTKQAYIVSFIDDWKEKVAWVNPERLIIEENINFNDKDEETKKQILRLVSIQKIEEFAILANKLLDATAKDALERLSFIERLPLGIYHFSLLPYRETEEKEKPERNCEVLIYSNIKQSYDDFINGLSDFFKKNKLNGKEFITEGELNALCIKVENEFFFGCVKYPGYNKQDLKDILQFYAQNEIQPKYIQLKDREKFDITQVANEILERDLGRKEEAEFKAELWDSNEVEWKAFFGYDKKYFLNEIDLAIRKLTEPELFIQPNVVPSEIKELRKLEQMSMNDIREHNPEYWKWLSDQVYNKHKDSEGFYFCVKSGFRSKNKLFFQIDHIKPFSKGGLTTLTNLQLLTRKENGLKGAFSREPKRLSSKSWLKNFN